MDFLRICIFLLMSLVGSNLAQESSPMKQILFPGEYEPRDNCLNRNMNKVHFNQSGYVNFVEFVADIPDLSGFHSCFWINVNSNDRGATPLSYYFDFFENADNLTIVWTGRPLFEFLVSVNGQHVAQTTKLFLQPKQWTHVCVSWSGDTGNSVFYVDGEMIDERHNSESIGKKVRGGGRMVSGQMMNTRAGGTGMDLGFGLEGDITLLHVSSVPLTSSPSDRRLIRQLSKNCCAIDRGDLVGWINTSRRGFAGVTEIKANQKCRQF